jgi:hypothetical protein
VKVNGFRIEIGEIENRLLQVPGVRDGAVVVAGSAETPQLVCYISGAQAPEPEAVREALTAVLPPYMVPQRVHRIAELPLTANGKTDKKALLVLAAEGERSGAGGAVAPPRTPNELRVAELWSQLLKVPLAGIGRESRFVDLGGTSMSAIRLVIALDRMVTVGDLARTSTLAEVAALLDRIAA